MEDDTRFTPRPRPDVCMHGVIGDCERCQTISDAKQRAGEKFASLLRAKLLADSAVVNAEQDISRAKAVQREARVALGGWLRKIGAGDTDPAISVDFIGNVLDVQGEGPRLALAMVLDTLPGGMSLAIVLQFLTSENLYANGRPIDAIRLGDVDGMAMRAAMAYLEQGAP